MAKEESVIIVKRKKGGGHGAHGGAWKVAYADFVTAMMAFFLVMWLMGSDEATKASISNYFNHPNTPYNQGKDPNSTTIMPLGDQQGEGDTLLNGAQGQFPEDMVQNPARPPAESIAQYKDLKKQVEASLQQIAYGMDLSLDHLTFSIAEEELFEPGATDLKPGSEKLLEKVGKIVTRWSGYMTIEGDVDSEAKGEKTAGESPYEFTMSRAVAVMNFFVDKRYMAENKIFPVGRGPRRAIASNDSEEGRKKNRRIQFTLSYSQKL